MLFGIVGGMRSEGEIRLFGQRLEIGVIGQHGDDLPVEFPAGKVVDEPAEAVLFLADEDGDFFLFAFAVEMDADFHVHFFAQFQQAGDQFGQVDADLPDINEHVHEEEAPDDALLDVFDVDAAFGHVGGELRDDPFLVLTQNADDGQDGLRHDQAPLCQGPVVYGSLTDLARR